MADDFKIGDLLKTDDGYYGIVMALPEKGGVVLDLGNGDFTVGVKFALEKVKAEGTQNTGINFASILDMAFVKELGEVEDPDN
jgi:hypothetical protein